MTTVASRNLGGNAIFAGRNPTFMIFAWENVVFRRNARLMSKIKNKND